MDRKLRNRTRSGGYAAAAFGTTALSPSEDEYSEIFGGFRGARGASAIPVLDLPVVEENESLFDFRLLDYSEVFGCFQGLDYVVSFQELFQRRSDGGDASSSDDAWTPVETECLSEEWDGSPNFSKCKSFGNESNQQCVGKQFHMSYERKHQMSKGVSNTARVAPVRAVPGYAYVIDQISPSQKIELQNPRPHMDDDDKLHKMEEREEFSEKLASYCETVKLEKGHLRNGSDSDEMYVTISEINLTTLPSDVPPPSRPPPMFDAGNGNSSDATSSLRANCNSSGSKSGNDSPPFVDLEVDVRFSTAESLASVTESVKKCQPKLKTSEEALQNKNAVMSQVSVCPVDEAKSYVAVGKSHNHCKDQKGDTSLVEDYGQQSPRKEIKGHLKCARPFPDVMEHNLMLNLTGKKKSNQYRSAEESCEARSIDEWVEVPEFIELVRSGNTKTHKQETGDDIIVQNRIIKECVKVEKRVLEQEEKINIKVSITTNKLDDDVEISEAVSKVTKQDDYYKEVCASLPLAHQCDEVGRKRIGDDLQIEDDIFIDIKQNEERIEDPRKFTDYGPAESFVHSENGRRVNDDLLGKPGEMNIREMGKEAHIEQENKRVIESNIEEAIEDDENIRNRKKCFKESLISEETKGKSRENFKKEENERRRKEEEEYVAKLMEASENEAEEMLKEALEEVSKRILMEDFQRTEMERKEKCEADSPHYQKISEHLSQYKDSQIFDRTNVRGLEVIQETHEGPVLMAGHRRSLNLTPKIDIGIDAANLRNYKTEKLNEKTAFNSAQDSEQDNFKSTVEVNGALGKEPNYDQGLDGVISECIPGAGTNEKLSDMKDNNALLNGHRLSSSALSEGALNMDQIGIKINNKLPNMDHDSRNIQRTAKVGKVTMPEKAHTQSKVATHDEVNTVKDKLAQTADGKIANNKISESTKFHMSDGRKQNPSQYSKFNQIVGGKEKSRNNSITPAEREKLERLRKERELELERLRKMEEEWEREREREKDRVAFESVTHNFRESAYPGLRERPVMDKASAEACQKELAKAREKLEEACAEPKEKSYSDKLSMEAKMRREQSAVERANAEARECADQSISSRFDAYPSTSYIDKVGGIEGESTQRCKARLERHQRTAERAAKALAEKNTRDLIAQREQAERHRLAESLDADVKRWSNGKQGNIRALLSTLQYILGAESGWQPVQLTDIITSAAVKKAYRKATLCVHPDKLQQRRATIQQKYICEKLFDLLKEAWNRFNSDER